MISPSTENLPKIIESPAKIRFQDCDPFNHLNNSEYLNYLNNAREDQLLANYGIDIYKMAAVEGKSWVTGSNQIAYLRPAWLMEDVMIQTRMLAFDGSSIKVEMQMRNADKSELKAIMWSTFIHYNLANQKREHHEQKYLDLFEKIVHPVEESSFEERVFSFKKIKL